VSMMVSYRQGKRGTRETMLRRKENKMFKLVEGTTRGDLEVIVQVLAITG